MESGNLLSNVPADLPEELMTTLVASPHAKIERIVSKGHCSPDGFWYDQDQHEWVLLVQGEAGLQFEDTPEVMHLTPGRYVHIPAHCKHRVAWTSSQPEAIWLAVFY
jgi:cupin 2 domain-containing protein